MALVRFLYQFYTKQHCNKQFAAKFSIVCNSLIFQHYVKCDHDNTVPKCRKWTSQTSEFQALNDDYYKVFILQGFLDESSIHVLHKSKSRMSLCCISGAGANPGADIEYWCNYILIPHASPYTLHWHTQASTHSLASPSTKHWVFGKYTRASNEPSRSL